MTSSISCPIVKPPPLLPGCGIAQASKLSPVTAPAPMPTAFARVRQVRSRLLIDGTCSAISGRPSRPASSERLGPGHSGHCTLEHCYLGRALNGVRYRGDVIPDALLAHPAPLGWQHINLTGDYLWASSTALEPEALLQTPGWAVLGRAGSLVQAATPNRAATKAA
jgi:hypothetical protein